MPDAESPMKRHPIPGTELQVSALCYGGGSLGTAVHGAGLDRLVTTYIEAGGNFFDTAHCYAFWKAGGAGASERELGACLRRLRCGDRVIVATKGGHPDSGEAYRRPDDFLSERVLTADIDESLRRLGVERIDLYYLHRDDPRVPVEAILETLNREIGRGRLRYLGASNWTTERMAAANDYAARQGLHGFLVSQLQWSLAEPNWRPGPDPTMRFVTDETARWHAAAGLPIAAYSATAGGYFAGSDRNLGFYENPTNRARRERARELAARLGCTPTQVALAYLMHQNPQVIPIFGTTDAAHLAEALGSLQVPLSAEEQRWLRQG
jgi:aryl-alcohol dehydrogenase-like predicted oxidoreductase